MNLGFQLFVSIGVFTFLGLWLDRKVGTTPAFTVLGLALGFGAGFYSLYRELFPSSARGRGESESEGPPSRRRREGPHGGLDTPDSKRDRNPSESSETGGRNRNWQANSGERDAGTEDTGKGRSSGGDGSRGNGEAR